MKKFKFRLERVLEYRSAVKQEKFQILSRKNAELAELKGMREQLEKAQLENEFGSGTMLATEIEIRGRYAAHLRDQIVQVELQIVQAEEAVQEALAEYREASKEFEVLDKLKERKRQEYDQYIAQEEEKFLDELSVLKGNTLETEERN